MSVLTDYRRQVHNDEKGNGQTEPAILRQVDKSPSSEPPAPETKLSMSRTEHLCNGSPISKKRAKKHNGTLIMCVQNLAVSGANAVLLNIIRGGFHPGNIIVLSPSKGELSKLFQEAGVAVRYGSLDLILEVVTDIRLVICNTIMTAHYVLLLKQKHIPHCWVLHEWWPKDILHSQLSARKLTDLTEETVENALKTCDHIIYVCNGQKKLYGSPAPCSVLPIGVPSPESHFYVLRSKHKVEQEGLFTFLVLGIVCPRKNQITAVKFFQEMAGDRKDLKMVIVGARHERDYEIEYLKQLEDTIGNDKRIELYPCTMDVEPYYAKADILLMTSTNEVTPLTISEAMLRGIPVITSDIAGIPDMLADGLEGFVISLDNKKLWLRRMEEVSRNSKLVRKMGLAAAKRAKRQYAMKVMIESYRKVAFDLSPPIVLVDMDGVLVDWDSGFRKVWNRPLVTRSEYEIEACVGEGYAEEAKEVYSSEGFFLNLPPMPGALEAVKAIASRGYVVKICTKPVLSRYCAQEKYEWVRRHLGVEWMSRIIMTHDKTLVMGALLIDDNPKVTGDRFPSWRQVIFTAPYNQSRTDLPRLESWDHWEKVFQTELLFAPTPSGPQPEEYSKLSVLSKKRSFNVVRNLSWPLITNESEINSPTPNDIEDEETEFNPEVIASDL